MAYRDAGDLESSQKHLALAKNYERPLPPIDDPAFREVERLRADQYWYQSEGMRLESNGRVEAAIESYETAIELDAEFVQPHVNLVALLGRLARFELAGTHYRRALELNSEIEELHNNWGTIQALRKQTAGSSREFSACAGNQSLLSRWAFQPRIDAQPNGAGNGGGGMLRSGPRI